MGCLSCKRNDMTSSQNLDTDVKAKDKDVIESQPQNVKSIKAPYDNTPIEGNGMKSYNEDGVVGKP